MDENGQPVDFDRLTQTMRLLKVDLLKEVLRYTCNYIHSYLGSESYGTTSNR